MLYIQSIQRIDSMPNMNVVRLLIRHWIHRSKYVYIGIAPDTTKHYLRKKSLFKSICSFVCLAFEEVRIIERLFLSSFVAVVVQHEPKKLKLFHFRKGSEICSYGYEKPILAVKLNRTVKRTCFRILKSTNFDFRELLFVWKMRFIYMICMIWKLFIK